MGRFLPRRGSGSREAALTPSPIQSAPSRASGAVLGALAGLSEADTLALARLFASETSDRRAWSAIAAAALGTAAARGVSVETLLKTRRRQVLENGKWVYRGPVQVADFGPLFEYLSPSERWVRWASTRAHPSKPALEFARSLKDNPDALPDVSWARTFVEYQTEQRAEKIARLATQSGNRAVSVGKWVFADSKTRLHGVERMVV